MSFKVDISRVVKFFSSPTDLATLLPFAISYVTVCVYIAIHVLVVCSWNY